MNEACMQSQLIKMACGKGAAEVHVPVRNLAGVFRPKPWPGMANPGESIIRSLASPIGTPPLLDIAKGRSDAVIVISDITRPVPNQIILPPILETLGKAGIPPSKTLILIATGMHRPNLGAELTELVGEEIASRYRVENHMGEDIQSHVDFGIRGDGIPLQVDRRYVEADLKILTGLIEPHLMAGYSGGRKGVLPGVCSLETLKVMHGYRMIQNPRTVVANLDDNPFHLTALELVREIGVDFIVNVTLNEIREISGVFSGDLDLAHREGVKALDQHVKEETTEQADIVITCAGGYPLDQTFYQCIKGMVAANSILKKGGTIVHASDLSEGMGGKSFCELVEMMESPQQMLDRLKEADYLQMDQWMLQDHCNILLYAGEIMVYSEKISHEWLRKALVRPIASLDEGLRLALEKHGPEARVAVMPQGPYVIAQHCPK